MEIIQCENQLQKITLANQLQSLQMFLDKDSLATFYWLIENCINEIKNVYFLNQNDEFGKPCYPLVIHINCRYNKIVDIINDTIIKKLYINEFGKTENIEIYLVYFYGKFAYCVPENSKKIDLFFR